MSNARYVSVAVSWLFLSLFLCSALHAQGLQQRKYSLELHILEPSMLVLNRTISNNGNWSVVLGAGLSGKFYNQYLATPNELKRGFIGMSYGGRAYDLSVRKYFKVVNENTFGVVLQSGVQVREIQWIFDWRAFVGSVPIQYHQVLPYVRTGFFYRLSNKFELSTLAGIGIHVYDVTGISEFIASGYIGYKLGLVKSK